MTKLPENINKMKSTTYNVQAYCIFATNEAKVSAKWKPRFLIMFCVVLSSVPDYRGPANKKLQCQILNPDILDFPQS